MRSWIGVALIVGVMSLASTALLTTSAAAQQQIISQRSGCCRTVDFAPRRRHIARYRNVDRSYVGFHYRPYLVSSCAYAQPYYLRSYPCNGPVPYAFGFRHDPVWW